MSGLNVTHAEGITRVVLDRPRVLNALTPDLLTELIKLCGDLTGRDSARVVVFEGAGNCFSAGADLPAFFPLLGGPDARSTADLGRRATNAIAELPQITIAAVRGHCVGGGLVLAGACDIRIASDDARFAIPELDAGIPLGWGGMAHLIRLVGSTLAADLVLSCRTFGPDEALQGGLISRIVPVEALDEAISELALAIARKPSTVLRITKRQLTEIRAGEFDPGKDADALLTALKDPEVLDAGRRYVETRLRKPSGT